MVFIPDHPNSIVICKVMYNTRISDGTTGFKTVSGMKSLLQFNLRRLIGGYLLYKSRITAFFQ